jgi:hypothetical protein
LYTAISDGKWQNSNVLNLSFALCIIIASGGQRLRRPVLRKGFAFPRGFYIFADQTCVNNLLPCGGACPTSFTGHPVSKANRLPSPLGLVVTHISCWTPGVDEIGAFSPFEAHLDASGIPHPRCPAKDIGHAQPQGRGLESQQRSEWFIANTAYNIRRCCEVLTPRGAVRVTCRKGERKDAQMDQT